MAYLHARSNVCRSGVTYSGLTSRSFGLTIGGVDRLADTQQSFGMSITKPLDGSSASCSLVFAGTAPAVGADLVLTLGGELLFGGTIQRVKALQEARLVRQNIVATDWWWLLNRYALVTGRYYGAINSIVARILNDYTNGGFLPGYLPSSLGSLDSVVFDGVTVGEAIKRLAKASNGGAGAFVRITPYKRIDIATNFPDGLALSLVNATNYHTVDVERIIDQVRTRVEAHGEGSPTTAVASAGATSIPVAECGKFSASGGSVWVDGVGEFVYTSLSAGSGPGSIVGASGLSHDVPQGATVRVRTVVNDATAQTALAAALGGGRSGVAVHRIASDTWSHTEAASQAAAQLTLLKSSQTVLRITAVAMPAAVMQAHEVGAVLASSVTVPQTITGDYRLQRVTISAFGPLTGVEPYFNLAYDARSTVSADLFDILGTMS